LDDGRLWRGGQHQVFLLLSELAARGVTQRLAAQAGGPLAERARQAGIEVEEIRFRGEFDLLAPGRIARLARAMGANIIHAHTGHAHTLGLRAVRRLANREINPVRLVTTRRVDFPISKGFFSRRKYTAPGQHFIAISEGVRRVLIEGGVAPERIERVASGVPPLDPAQTWQREKVRESLGIAPDEIAIVNIGALTDHKGQKWLIDAAPQILRAFPAARIHILGDGELRSALEGQIRALGLEGRVLLHGFVGEARLKLAGFDLFVSSSHLEGLGTVILDAMLAGLPVVAAEAGGVPDAVIDGETGRLVPPRDPAALAEAVIAALGEPAQSQGMAERARWHAKENFSARAMAEGTLGVYRKLLGTSYGS
jgi:glycosyltransferase involved in cell wall biosynthesis